MNGRERRRGFTLVELGVGVALIGIGAGLLAPMLERSRSQATQTVDAANMRQIAQAGFAYASEFGGRMPTFSWRVGDADCVAVVPRLRPHLEAATHDGQAAAVQALDIIERRSGVAIDFAPDWLPHTMYWPLILQDYLASRLPEPILVSRRDTFRLGMLEDLGPAHDNGFVPARLANTPTNRALVFSSSYQQPPAFYDRGQSEWTKLPRVSQSPDSHRDFVIPADAELGPQRMSDVVFPSAKVMLHTDRDYYSQREPLYWADPRASVHVACVDGSVRRQATREVNPGWDPTKPHDDGTTTVTFAPAPWEVQADPEGELLGRMRWTRGGLRGLDVGGQEIRTGKQP